MKKLFTFQKLFYLLLGITAFLMVVDFNPLKSEQKVTMNPAIEVANTDSLSNPSLGIGLNGISDWSTQLPFINHFKTARNWIGHQPNSSGGYSWGGVPEAEFELDENGYPTSIPVVNGQTAAMGTVLFTGIEEEAIPGGRYVVLYEGEGTLEYTLSGKKIISESEPGRDIINFTPEGNLLGINITETDPNQTGNNIRNIRVIREDQLDLYEAGAIFNPQWLEKIQDFRSLRFMNWMQTNNSDVSEWNERPKTDDASWTNGVPLELMIELANETGTDPWFNIPHQATDEYIRNLGEMVKAKLGPNLKAHFEFSNEVWNWQFEQAQYAHQQGQARWGEDVGTAWLQWYGMRSAQMAQILDQVYGEEADERLVKIIATQTAYQGIEKNILEAPEWVAEGNPAPHTFFDAYAVTGYFGRELGLEDDYNQLSPLIKEDRELAFQQAFQKLEGYLSNTLSDIEYQSNVAQAYNLDLVAYEAGTHVVGHGQVTNDEEYTAFLIELNRRPEMGNLYDQLLEGWKDAGGTLFNHFVDVGEPSKYGSWGALAHLNDATPRWDAINEFNASTSGWWETRSEGTYDQGLILEGDEGNNVLIGSNEGDILIGGEGDDTLVANGGDDKIHGGDGFDTLILDQAFDEYQFRRERNGLIIESAEESNFVTAVESFSFSDGVSSEMSLEDLQRVSFFDGLITRWNFDEDSGDTVFDSGPNDHHGRNDGLRTQGRSGQGVELDGKEDLVTDNHQGSYLNGLNAITLSIWVKADETGTDHGIFSTLDTNAQDTHLGMRYDDRGWAGGGDDVIKLALQTTAGSIQYESSSHVQTTQWQHLAMVWESGNSLQLYINGELDHPTYSSGKIGGVIAGVEKLELGRAQQNFGVWDGVIDEFEIYNRPLNAEEIALLSNLEPIALKMLTQWQFDEESGHTVADSSGNDYDAILGNNPTRVDGVLGHGVGFDGKDDLVTDNHQGSYLNGLNAITLSIWVKADETGTDHGIFSTLDTNAQDTHLGMRYDDRGLFGGGDDVIKLALQTTAGSIQYESSSHVQTTQWQHLAMVWESGKSLQLYINGELDHPTYSSGKIGGVIAGVEKLELGRAQQNFGVWDGVIDEFTMFNQALEAEQIASLANLDGSGIV